MFPVMHQSMSSILFNSVYVYRVRMCSERHFQAGVSATFRHSFIALLSGSGRYFMCLIRKWTKSSQVWDQLNWRSRGQDLKIRLPWLCNANSSPSLQHMLFLAASFHPPCFHVLSFAFCLGGSRQFWLSEFCAIVSTTSLILLLNRGTNKLLDIGDLCIRHIYRLFYTRTCKTSKLEVITKHPF